MQAHRTLSREAFRAFARTGVQARTLASTTPQDRTPGTAVDDGPVSPQMLTQCPGPKSLDLFKELVKVQECSAVAFFVDYEESYGNYIVDADGNRMLDMYAQVTAFRFQQIHQA
jgi:hypothetical protein